MVAGSEDAADALLLNSGECITDLSLSSSPRKKQSTTVFVGLTLFATTFLVYTTYLIVSDFLFGGYVWFDIDKPNNDPRIYKFLPELIENAPPIVVVQDPGAGHASLSCLPSELFPGKCWLGSDSAHVD